MESREDQIEREGERLRDVQTEADRISRLILDSDLPWIDVMIQIDRLRRMVSEQFRGKEDLFDLIYVSRFQRLWRQFRPDPESAALLGY